MVCVRNFYVPRPQLTRGEVSAKVGVTECGFSLLACATTYSTNPLRGAAFALATAGSRLAAAAETVTMATVGNYFTAAAAARNYLTCDDVSPAAT